MRKPKYLIYPVLLLLLCIRTLSAQIQEKRVALVIGNSHYANARLVNPANDARDMAMILRRAGFSVTEKYDQNVVELNNAVTDFTRKFTDPNTVALFYFAGHGIHEDNKNYIIPIDADSLEDDQISFRCVSLERITAKMKLANNYMNIVILDACRSYQVGRQTRGPFEGLAQFDEEISESLIAFATAPGHVSLDQSNKPNGLFTEKLLKHIETPGLEISELFFEVRKDVKEQSNNMQVPSLVNNLTRKFYFFGGPGQTEPPVQPADADNDGVPDNIDRCPKDYGPANLQGCPDSDGDRVIDLLDNCPLAFGLAGNKGCPEEKSGAKRKSARNSGIGVNYSRFGAHYSSDPYIKSIYFNSYQLDYFFVNKIGGFVSFGTYSGGYDLTSSNNYPINTYLTGTIGPGVQILHTSSDFKGYAFAGLMFFLGKKSDEEVFGHPTNYVGYQFILSGSINHIGLKAGFIAGFQQVKGFTAGMYYSF